MEIFLAGCASYLFIFLKSWQQRNVAFDKYLPVIPTSLLMAATEVYVISAIVVAGYSLALVLSIGLGAGLGSSSGMYLHRRVFGRQR